jgi:hypothetical protein
MKVVFCTHLRGVYTSLFRSTQHPMLMDFAAEFERLALSFFEPCDRAADNLSIIGREYEPDVSRSTSLRTSAYMVSYDRYQWIIPRVVTIPKLTRIYILAVLSQRSNAPNPTNPLSPYLLQGYTPKDTCIVSLQHTPVRWIVHLVSWVNTAIVHSNLR